MLHQVRHLVTRRVCVIRCPLSHRFSRQIAPQGFDHPDLPALTVAINVLNAMESYLWKAIRGTGLAYGAYLRHNPESGHVYLDINRSPDSWKAVTEAGRVMRDLIDRKV